jgi:sugar phosphate isomerase/epimerase
MQPFQIGVCSWSLRQPDLPAALRVTGQELGLKLIQIGFFDEAVMDPANDRAVLEAVAHSGLTVSATCVGFAGEDYATIDAIARTGGYVPDADFDRRLAKTLRVRDLTAALGAPMMTTHIGFVPRERRSPLYRTMVDRLQRVTDALAEKEIMLTMETGQEPATHLRQFIHDVGWDTIRVNFDPANMVLYGAGDPVEAIGILGDKIAHVHAKDARPSDQPGKVWGQEVRLGDGQADLPGVIAKLRQVGYAGPLVIEREAGQDRVADVRHAVAYLQSLL